MANLVAVGTASPSLRLITQAFFPDIDPEDFRLAMRQDKTVTNDRLVYCLTNAALDTNKKLSLLANLGITALADITDQQINGQNHAESMYHHAVYCKAKAVLVRTYADYDATHHGNTEHRDSDFALADSYLADAAQAIVDINGLAVAYINASGNPAAATITAQLQTTRLRVELL